MSEYQYYEFQAVDRLLDAAAQAELRRISSRARISAASFVNSYDWGDLKADPLKLLERYFDLHLYLANWGTRRFAMKLPRRLLDPKILDAAGIDQDTAILRPAGEHAILSILRTEIDADDWDDGSGWLASLGPVRADLLAGDWRLFPLLWLMEVECGAIDDEARPPPPGLGPLSPALAALADFLWIDPDLLAAAGMDAPAQAMPAPATDEVEAFVRRLPEAEKVALLMRVHAGDASVHAELQQRSRPAAEPGAFSGSRPTAGELRAAASRAEEERERRAREREAAERQQREEEARKAREQRIQALAAREEAAWREAETLIGERNRKGYEKAAALLSDLGAVADRNDARETFARRLGGLRARHAGKYTLIERLDAAGLRGQ